MTLDKQIILMEELLSDDDHWSSKKAKSEYKQLLKWLKDYKRLLEMPKSDSISREALKKEVESLVSGGAERLKDYYENGSKSDENAWIGGVYDCWELIDNAPTVEVGYLTNCANCERAEKIRSKRPQGKWIFRQGVTCGGYYKCNRCGEVERAEKNYCPNCGADMRKGGNNE